MNANYNKLFKMMIDRRMKKNELSRLSGVSASSISKLGRNENVFVDILIRIARVMDCGLDDIVEILPDGEADDKI